MVLKRMDGRSEYWLVWLLFASFQFYGVAQANILGTRLGPWDFVIVVLALLFLLRKGRVPRGAVRLQSHFRRVLGLVTIFTCWTSISALLSPEPGRGLTMFLQLLRNSVLLILVGGASAEPRRLEDVNRAIFKFGVVVASVSLVLYLRAWLDYDVILSSPTLWKPSIGYVLDQGGVLRLTGFAKDPNFYSLWLCPALLVGLAFARPNVKQAFGTLLIGVSIVLAMSRGFILSFVSSAFVLIGLSLVRGDSFLRLYASRLAGIVIMTLPILGFLRATESDFWKWLLIRQRLAAETPRLEMWSLLLSRLETDWNPLWGAGLRGAEEALGGLYSHNSYIDVIFEAGLVGFLLWMMIVGYVTRLCLRQVRVELLAPWALAWLIMIVTFVNFSLVYNPFPWLIMGILLRFEGLAERSQQGSVGTFAGAGSGRSWRSGAWR